MNSLLDMMSSLSNQRPQDCYQCGRCSAGCPQNEDGVMDLSPNRIMHLLKMEKAFSDQPDISKKYRQRILRSETIWLCASCHICSQRCPQNIDISGIMESLCQISLREDEMTKNKRGRDIINSHKAFLSTIKRNGRNDEVALVGEYKMRTGNILSDMDMAPKMALRGKLTIQGAMLSGMKFLNLKSSPQMDSIQRSAEIFAQEEDNL